MTESIKPLSRIAVVVACLAALPADPASAQAMRSGTTNPAIAAGLLRGSATAYDSINKIYLVVAAHGFVYGRFVNADGVPIGVQFPIQSNAANWGAFPRVAFSPDADGGAGAFLVSWTESDAATGMPWVTTRLVSYTKGPLGAASDIVGANLGQPAANGNGEQGNAIAYSSTSKLFLLAYTRRNPLANLTAYRINVQGLAIDQVAIPAKAPSDGERDPSVAYDPDDNQFLITYAGWTTSFAFVRARRIDAASGAVLDQVPIPVYASSGTYITDAAYDTRTKSYLSAFYSGVSLGRLVKPDGTMPGGVTVLSTLWVAYDALSVAYNPISGTYFMVSHSSNWEDGGVEIKTDGNPVDNGFRVTSTPASNGNFYPRISASTDQPRWLMSTAYNMTTAMVQLVAGTASGPPPPPPPDPKMGVDSPLANASLPGRFNVTGWAIDKGATSGTGVDGVHVWAYPNPGSGTPPIFLGAAQYGLSRPDVAAAASSTQFTNSGFTLSTGGLWPSVYDIVAYSHSSVTGTFSLWTAVRVNVRGFLAIDTPATMSSAGTFFSIGGWAVDGGAATGSGIDAVHVWAYPEPGSGTPPVFLGAAALHLSRPDVVAALGNSQFADAGYNLFAWGLQSGHTYDLVAFAHSAVTQTFIDWKVVRVAVSAWVTVDGPAGATSAASFTIGGWALDTASPTGTGIDLVHVWAYPNPGSGAPPVFLGQANYGGARPDIVTPTGPFDPRFTNSGYSLDVTLAPGTYDIVVYARSTLTSTFRAAKVVRITVP
jgi:hypothetical protein